MTVRFFYIDESYNNDFFCLSALSIRHTDWKECFALVKEHRQMLKADYGIPLLKEIHATDLVGGRGQLSSRGVIGKFDRSLIFQGLLNLVARLPTVFLFNVCLERRFHSNVQMKAWDRMVNRIERTMRAFEQVELPKRQMALNKINQAMIAHGKFLSESEFEELNWRLNLFRSRALIIADEGREHEITGALRKMRVHNPIPSKFGEWTPGRRTKNITTDRIIDDPVFRDSSRSYFLQLIDCVAFALLKKESQPTPLVAKYQIDKMFDVLGPACYKKACQSDPFGIARK